MSQASVSHITRTPGLCGGKPCIQGSRIRVQDIYVWHELQGKKPDEIVHAFPQLSLADVYSALAYFWDHREEILHEMSQQDHLAEQMQARWPSKLEAKLSQKGSGHAISP